MEGADRGPFPAYSVMFVPNMDKDIAIFVGATDLKTSIANSFFECLNLFFCFGRHLWAYSNIAIVSLQ